MKGLILCVRNLSLLLFVLLWMPFNANASTKITLYFNDRPPFLVAQRDGSVQGLTATPAVKALQDAGLAFQWKKANAEQQLSVINRNLETACLVGWFKRPERLLLGKFSAPIYAGKSMTALSLANNPRLSAQMRVADLMRNTELRLLVKSGYSYGHILDQHIKNFGPVQVVATGENINMLQMLVHQRADYFLVSEEEGRALVLASGLPPHTFRMTYFIEGIKEDPRYFWCTRQVSDDSLKKINAALQKNLARQSFSKRLSSLDSSRHRTKSSSLFR